MRSPSLSNFLCNVISSPTRHSISRLDASDSRCTLFSTWRKASLEVISRISSLTSIFDDLFTSEDPLALAMIRTPYTPLSVRPRRPQHDLSVFICLVVFDCSILFVCCLFAAFYRFVTILGPNQRAAVLNGTKEHCLFVACLVWLVAEPLR